MKQIILIVCALMASVTLAAQDIIVTKDAKKIEAKILEVSTSEIRYKELDNLDGPIFILRTDEINCIMYANGKVVLYNQSNTEEENNKKAKEKAEAFISGIAFGEIETQHEGIGKAYAPSKDECNQWSLAGRGLVERLPKPANTFNQEGTVVVQIRVNAAGEVIKASVKESNITDKQTLQLVLDAAKKAKFTSDTHESVGTITYKLKFN